MKGKRHIKYMVAPIVLVSVFSADIKQVKADVIKTKDLVTSYRVNEYAEEPSRGGINNKRTEVVNQAYKLLGKPYVYGATGPNEFDCSGLTQYVYKKAGRNISRTTYTQVKEGIEVKKCDLRPGDLVFFNTQGSMSHVGIYIGNGDFIHAPRTGKPVMISNLNNGYYCNKYATARRIFR